MKLLQSLISSTALSIAAAAPTLAAISISSVALASKPVHPIGCPDGWIPAPNPQLGCIPNRIKPKKPSGIIKLAISSIGRLRGTQHSWGVGFHSVQPNLQPTPQLI